MTKAQRLRVENEARQAIGAYLNCAPDNKTLHLGAAGPDHEFDIYAPGIVIGGVSTSTFKTFFGNPNTGSRDRAAAELLWLALWPGNEERVHVLTDSPLATWLVQRFKGASFPYKISVYHFDRDTKKLTCVGTL